MNYWLQRAGLAVLLLLAVSCSTFAAMNVVGDPLSNILGPVAGAKDVRGIAQVDGYALRSQGEIPSGSFTVVAESETLGHGESVRVTSGETLPRRADTVAGLDAVVVTESAITIVETPRPGQFVANGPEPGQLAAVEAAEQEFHLDQPLPTRYVAWLTDFVRG